MQSNAQKKALAAQQAALDKQKPVDVEATQASAKQADLDKFKAGFEAQNQYDPVTGQIRAKTNDALSQFASNDTNENAANSALGALSAENLPVDSRDVQFTDTLKGQAQSALDQGGALSPEQQAEFVRAGLEGASTTGLNAGSSTTRQSIGKLLASEQLAQQEQRQNMAKNLFGFATDLKSQRNNTLSNIASNNLGASAQHGNKLLNLAQLADSRVPDVGLSGGDIANLNVANTNQANGNAMQQGAIQANNAVARGQIAAGLVGGITSAAGSFAGNYASSLGKTPTYSNNPSMPSITPLAQNTGFPTKISYK
jgi:hypothetical protein